MKTRMFILILLVAIFLESCASFHIPEFAQNSESTATPDLTVDIRTLDDKTEDELISFMLDYILQSRIDHSTDFVQTRGEPWLNAPESAIIISYGRAGSDGPIKVWWYFDNQLIEATDSQMGENKWHERFVHNSPNYTWPDNIGFSVVSVSDHNTKATIYYSLSTCSECAAAFLFTLEKSASGEWLVIKSETLWMG